MNLYALGLAALAAACSGCGNLEEELGRSSDPNRALSLFGAIVITVFVISFFLAGGSIQNHLYRAIKWPSAIALAASPLYWLTTHSIGAGIAAGLTGIIGLGLSLTAFRTWGIPAASNANDS